MDLAYIIAIAVVAALIVLFVMFRGGIGFFRGNLTGAVASVS